MSSVNPAKYIGVFDKLGSIEVGKLADLLIVDDHFSIKDVYMEGKLHPIH